MSAVAESRKGLRHGTRNAYERRGCRCDECRAANAIRIAAWRERNREHINAKYRERYDRDHERIGAKKLIELRTHPEKNRAHNKLKWAVRIGRVVPQPCEVGADCLGDVQAHHDDYDKPLDVRWLCRRHHMRHHARSAESSEVGALSGR